MPEIVALEKHPLPGVRRAGGVDPVQAEARVPVLRYRGAVRGRQGHGQGAGARPGVGAALDPGRRPRLADRPPQRAVPELQGGDGVRPGARRSELRVLRLPRAGRLPGDQVADPAAEPASFQGDGGADSRAHARLVRRALVRPGQAQAPRAGRSDAKASTCRTGRSTHRRSARGEPRPGTTTSSPRATPTTRASGRRVRFARSGGSRPAATSRTSSTTSRCPAAAASTPACCAASSRFQPRNSSPTTRHSCQGSSSSTTKWCCWTPPGRGASG